MHQIIIQLKYQLGLFYCLVHTVFCAVFCSWTHNFFLVHTVFWAVFCSWTQKRNVWFMLCFELYLVHEHRNKMIGSYCVLFILCLVLHQLLPSLFLWPILIHFLIILWSKQLLISLTSDSNISKLMQIKGL